MRISKALIALAWLIAVLGAIAAAAGLFWLAGPGPSSFTTLHGQVVQLDGYGLYRNDTVFTAGSFRGADVITLIVAVPLLIFAILRYRAGSLRGGFLLAGMLSYFLYQGVSVSFASAYNELFLLYIAYFSASLFAFILAFTAIDLAALPGRVSTRLPRRGIAAFLFIAGGVVVVLWLSDVIASLLAGRTPELVASYTTVFTYAIDVAVIAPAAVLAGVLVLRRQPLGWLLACVMLILNALIGIVVIGQTVFQTRAGIVFAPPQLIGLIGSWIVLAFFAIWLVVALLRSISEKPALAGSQRAAASGQRLVKKTR